MIKNYLLITLRNFLRNKNYTLINVAGLSIGITSCIIIFLIISYELSFDKFNTKFDDIYRVVQISDSESGIEYEAGTPYPLPRAFRNDFNDIPLGTQVHFQDEALIKYGEFKQRIDNVLFADSLFFDVFDFKVLSGNPHVDLGQPGKVFLTKSLADRLLKGSDHGTIKLENIVELEVAGIIQDPPPTSHINFSMVVSMPSLTKDFIGGWPLDQWGLTASGYFYFVLPKGIHAAEVEDRFKAFVTKYHQEEEARRRTYLLQPLQDIHFNQQYKGAPGNTPALSYTQLVVMGVLAIFILVIASINFINLATALAIRKSKEIGIRKTLGAKRNQLTLYFLGETFLITLCSVLISLGITEWLLSWINQFLDKQLQLNLFSNVLLLGFLLGLILITTVLSGFYPAMVLSGFNPVAVLKNKMSAQGSSGAFVRKVLVVFQFMIAQVLIIGTLIIADQMSYFRNKSLGFQSEAVINVALPDNNIETIESLRTRFGANPGIKNVTFCLGAPTSDNNFGTSYALTEKKDQKFSVGIKTVDTQYKDAYGIELISGRWFTESDEKTSSFSLPKEQQKYTFVVNEAAARQLGFNEPQDIVGKYVSIGIYDVSAEVIGVVKDFHTASLHNKISPVVMVIMPQFYFDIGFKVKTDNLQKTIKEIEDVWTAKFPDYYFDYEFLDQSLEKLYRNDERTFTLFKIFAAVSIFIGCLGLFGLISFMANQKLKEVGIRKVLGASVGNIVLLFSKEFIKLILVAFAIAAPLAWYFMHEWLQSFAYRVSIHWWIFGIGVVSTLVIALVTVSYRSLQAAVSNPAETLRTE
jgi:ABC-type antimicrobial peptide transport system permease subunit